MSFTEKRLCNPTQLTTSGQTLYTVPASKTAIIKQIVVTNVTASAVTFSLYIGSAATPNALFNATSVAANDTIIVNLSQVLNQFEALTALASTNLALNITISGVENDGPLNPLSTYIADQAITTAKLADSSVTQSKLGSSLSGITITTSSTRATDIPSPFEGQLSYLTDIDELDIYNGSTWLRAVVTTDDDSISASGSLTAASFIPTSSTVPVNGLYLSNTNEISFSTNSTRRLYIDSSGNARFNASNYNNSANQLLGSSRVLWHQQTLSSGSSSAAANNLIWFFDSNINTLTANCSNIFIIFSFSCFNSGAGSIRGRVRVAGVNQDHWFFTNEGGSHKQFCLVNYRSITPSSSTNIAVGIYSAEQTINVDQNDGATLTVLAG